MGEVNGNVMENQLMTSLQLFVNEIESYDNLKIVAEVEGGGCDGSDILVLENSEFTEDVEGHQITVEVPEIFAKCRDAKQAKRFAAVVNSEEDPIKLHGITRIVGYYSRVTNWNKSKIGELRDRQKGQYGTPNHVKQHSAEALQTVDAM
jgi:anaerobic ribonucleoside-triphosphate reductase